MTSIIFASTAVTAIGFLCAAILAAASKIMYVPTNENTDKIRECLPGANCGACGFAGCDGYSEALSSGADVPTNKCIPGGDNVSLQISEILGVDFEDVEEMLAVVRCGGSTCSTHNKMDYSGTKTCAAANLFYGGQGACEHGCLGFGDCQTVCPNGAISVRDGAAHVDTELCTGCGLCAKQCPKSLIAVVPAKAKTVVLCSNTNKGAATRAACSNGCLGCGKCVKECSAQAISVVNNLAVVDNEKCSGCGACAGACPTKCIRFVGVPEDGTQQVVLISNFLIQEAKKR